MEQGESNRDYFARRAAEERVAADRASDHRAADSHRRLAAELDALACRFGQTAAAEGPGSPGILGGGFRILA